MPGRDFLYSCFGQQVITTKTPIKMKSTEKGLVAYEAPKVEVIEVLVEQGFAASDEPADYRWGGNL